MRTFHAMGATALGAALLLLGPATAQPPADGKVDTKKDAPPAKPDPNVEAWVKLLGEKMTDRHDAIRDSARAALVAIGKPALPTLKKLVDGDDGATATAATKVIAQIEHPHHAGHGPQHGPPPGPRMHPSQGRPGIGGRPGMHRNPNVPAGFGRPGMAAGPGGFGGPGMPFGPRGFGGPGMQPGRGGFGGPGMPSGPGGFGRPGMPPGSPGNQRGPGGPPAGDKKAPPKAGPPAGPGAPGARGGIGGAFSPAGFLQMMVSDLDLTDKQKEKVKELVNAHEMNLREAMEKLRDGKDRADREVMRTAFTKFRDEMLKDVKGILTPEQVKKLEKNAERGPGGPGGPPRGPGGDSDKKPE